MPDYNETLRKISNSLANALDTFGPSSEQYQAILAILKECLREIEDQKTKQARDEVVDADMLSTAMRFLEISK